MPRDFTRAAFRELVSAGIHANYRFVSVEQFMSASVQSPRVVMLRHDVDARPAYALELAKMEAELGAQATYYFRCVPKTFHPRIIDKIVRLGHEVGYHYEDVALAEGDLDAACNNFKRELARLRELYPVRTICMHGSPRSRWDNRDIWKVLDYRAFGIIAEPYLDCDFERVLYLSDTGRSWNNHSVSVRDSVRSSLTAKFQFSSTFDIAAAFRANRMPDCVMINTHPQRWTDDVLPWGQEFFWQNMKNVIKRAVVARRVTAEQVRS